MQDQDKLELVKDRLHLLSLLIDSKSQFSGAGKMRKDNNIYQSHPYKDYTALRYYLVLTCFDILGQPNDWKDFQSWLISKKSKKERDSIIEKNGNKDKIDLIKLVHSEYSEIYGVKNSFYKFIREIISKENQQKLFDSIATSIEISPDIITKDGVRSSMGKSIILEKTHKEKFLFEIRNSFTHKGISIGINMTGLHDFDKPIPYPPDWNPKWLFNPILKKKINGDTIWFKVRRWPFVLIEIVEDTINQKN